MSLEVILCKNDCGFFGSEDLGSLCSICFRKIYCYNENTKNTSGEKIGIGTATKIQKQQNTESTDNSIAATSSPNQQSPTSSERPQRNSEKSLKNALHVLRRLPLPTEIPSQQKGSTGTVFSSSALHKRVNAKQTEQSEQGLINQFHKPVNIEKEVHGSEFYPRPKMKTVITYSSEQLKKIRRLSNITDSFLNSRIFPHDAALYRNGECLCRSCRSSPIARYKTMHDLSNESSLEVIVSIPRETGPLQMDPIGGHLKEICSYGVKCFRRNPQHLKKFTHFHLDHLFPKYVTDQPLDILEEMASKFEIENPKLNLILDQLKIMKEERMNCVLSTEDTNTAAPGRLPGNFSQSTTKPTSPQDGQTLTTIHDQQIHISCEKVSKKNNPPISAKTLLKKPLLFYNSGFIQPEDTIKTVGDQPRTSKHDVLVDVTRIPSQFVEQNDINLGIANKISEHRSQVYEFGLYDDVQKTEERQHSSPGRDHINIEIDEDSEEPSNSEYQPSQSKKKRARRKGNGKRSGQSDDKLTGVTDESSNDGANDYDEHQQSKRENGAESYQKPVLTSRVKNKMRNDSQIMKNGKYEKAKQSKEDGSSQKFKRTVNPISEWYAGCLRTTRGDACFISPKQQLPEEFTQKDVYIQRNKFSTHILAPKNGDKVEFLLGHWNKERPMARSVRVTEFAYRHKNELIEYFDNIKTALNSPACNEVLASVLHSGPLWKFLGFVKFRNSNDACDYVFCLLNFLNDIIKAGKHYQTISKDMLKNVLSGFIFQSSEEFSLQAYIRRIYSSSESNNDITSKQEVLFNFCLNVVQSVPTLAFYLFPVVDILSETDPSVEKQRFLSQMLKLSNNSSLEPDTGRWEDLPLILTGEELTGGLVKKDKHLSSVKLGIPYDSPEDYMDTYFRLLRAEAFSSLQIGINDLRENKLDHRDMDVYSNVHLVGYEITDSSMNLAIKFESAKQVKRWESSPQLMFGNLLCLSPNRKFNDVIWATVSNRDVKLLNKSQVISIELIEFNTLTTSQIMVKLLSNGGSIVMVESPTYFQAFRPILHSLKVFDVENFPLQAEIVKTEHQIELPSYLELTSTFDISCLKQIHKPLYKPLNDTQEIISVYKFLKTFSDKSDTPLEVSQVDALKQTICNRLAIIQGPPGCGKTFLGSKIVQLLLTLEPGITRPILLLTYKNHALDEFLKHMLAFVSKSDVARLGGRSKDPELEECSWNFINRNNRPDTAKEIYANIQLTRREIEQLKMEIEDLSGSIDNSCYFTKTSIIETFSDEQIKSLLVDIGWKKKKHPSYQINKDTFANSSWIMKQVNAILNEFGSLKDFILSGSKSKSADALGKVSQSGNLILFAADRSRQDILFKLSDFPLSMEFNSSIQNVRNVWSLTEVERMQFIYSHLKERNTEVFKELDDAHTLLTTAQGRKRELETQQKVCILMQKKIIGMTITGASIHHDIIHNIGPSIVIVEEAAEILEPSLLAALTPDIQHLILIGDHKQLKPKVETFDLRRNHNFDVSMMERLIEAGFPYRTLCKQNRMRPEFAELLHDIYPKLQDNTELVCKNEPLACLEKSMFFWSHHDKEHKGRTFTNAKEAVCLVLYLLMNGCKPSDITVLSAYQGQTKLLREKLKKEELERQDIFKAKGEAVIISVQTIDMFQGDENEYVLVSLVRSNSDRNIGFFREINRRCVAQSRAKCGMYFVGNAKTFLNAKGSCWGYMIEKMKINDCVGSKLALQCSKHGALSKCPVSTADELRDIVNNPERLCKRVCGDQLPCKILGHFCKKPCYPRHSHVTCQESVDDKFPKCKHPVTRKCNVQLSNIRCEAIVDFTFHRCGHPSKKKCWQDESMLSCKDICVKKMVCNIHYCPQKCGAKHTHEKCLEKVKFKFPNCKHEAERSCWQTIENLKCEFMVDVILPQCHHQIQKQCFKDTHDVACPHPCKEMMTCRKHICHQKCGKPHDHNNCQNKIDYKFPDCRHSSPMKKICSEKIIWPCTFQVHIKGCCGHNIERKCHQKDSDVKCPFKPCSRPRSCGHPCTNECGDDCEKGDCKICKNEHTKRDRLLRQEAEKKIKVLKDKIAKNPATTFTSDTIHKSGHTTAEYQQVEDKVKKYIQPYHNWYPSIVKVEKVSNLVLEKKFEEAKLNAFGDYIGEKFHGTDDAGIAGITNNGFRLPDQNPPPNIKRGMYGQGIYFATDSSKSAQEIYTKGSDKLLLCQVVLGKAKTVMQKDRLLDYNRLHREGYDSVYAPRGSDVHYDEFVIFNPDQALPQYIIHYVNGLQKPASFVPQPTPNQPFSKKTLVAKREIDLNDPYDNYYRLAACHFMTMKGRSNGRPQTIKAIDVVFNYTLQQKFDAQQSEFKRNGIPDGVILAYHGTYSAYIDNILKNNLQVSHARRQAYGRGNYFLNFLI